MKQKSYSPRSKQRLYELNFHQLGMDDSIFEYNHKLPNVSFLWVTFYSDHIFVNVLRKVEKKDRVNKLFWKQESKTYQDDAIDYVQQLLVMANLELL